MTSDEPSQERSEDSQSQGRERSDWAKAGIIGALGFELVGFVAAGLFVGNWVDSELGSAPLGLMVGLFAALVAAGVHIWKMLTRLMPDDDDAP